MSKSIMLSSLTRLRARGLVAVLALLLASFVGVSSATAEAVSSVNGETVETLDWEVLMPPGYTLDGLLDDESFAGIGTLEDGDPQADLMMSKLQEALNSAPVVPEMDGKMVRLPGFVVPLEGEDQTIYTFFLVPYFGACIHVPPPPSNQIVYVHYEPGVKLESLYDAVWITGKLRTENFSNEMASSGYSMEAFRIEPYDG
ncbi:DUF3299 domain-containing protein [Neptunomonas phycophila]|uniref:DUF3299 domain-containing protein n=2 Tax=Neptunomonas phycophila TaxID=1572645 RepID=A0ABT9ESK3_9GAMM|nr:DUF3299 domain-containing protein [Neptunomonas phycophila]MDO6783717.1 DUF3299 domain-containing protein [Neptunomonas phycophila]MDP2521747.1 DUF3299 domain-containing protein [Neptunomonas phycophila]